MIKTILISISIVFFSCIHANACKCVMPRPSIEESAQNKEVIFIGKCIVGEYKDEGDINTPETYKYKTVWTFKVQKKFKGAVKSKTIKIETGIGAGDCGVLFKLGFSYLVYGELLNGNIGTNICNRTKIVGIYPIRIDDRIENELKILQKIFNKN